MESRAHYGGIALDDGNTDRNCQVGPANTSVALASSACNTGEHVADDDARRAQSADADLDRLEHEQGTTAELWSGDWGAELERLELDPETRCERGHSEPPERGIEDEELER